MAIDKGEVKKVVETVFGGSEKRVPTYYACVIRSEEYSDDLEPGLWAVVLECGYGVTGDRSREGLETFPTKEEAISHAIKVSNYYMVWPDKRYIKGERK